MRGENVYTSCAPVKLKITWAKNKKGLSSMFIHSLRVFVVVRSPCKHGMYVTCLAESKP